MRSFSAAGASDVNRSGGNQMRSRWQSAEIRLYERMSGPPSRASFEERHGFAGALPSVGGMGAISGPPSSIYLCLGHLGRLPGDHTPLGARLHIDREVPNCETLFFAVPLHVHLRHAVDDTHIAVDAGPALARRDAAIVRLAPAQIRDVLGLGLEPGCGVHVG